MDIVMTENELWEQTKIIKERLLSQVSQSMVKDSLDLSESVLIAYNNLAVKIREGEDLSTFTWERNLVMGRYGNHFGAQMLMNPIFLRYSFSEPERVHDHLTAEINHLSTIKEQLACEYNSIYQNTDIIFLRDEETYDDLTGKVLGTGYFVIKVKKAPLQNFQIFYTDDWTMGVGEVGWKTIDNEEQWERLFSEHLNVVRIMPTVTQEPNTLLAVAANKYLEMFVAAHGSDYTLGTRLKSQ